MSLKIHALVTSGISYYDEIAKSKPTIGVILGILKMELVLKEL